MAYLYDPSIHRLIWVRLYICSLVLIQQPIGSKILQLSLVATITATEPSNWTISGKDVR